MSAYLRYIGNGSWLPDTPARDLNEEEAKYYGVGRLIDSKLYEFVTVEYDTPNIEQKSAPRKRGKDGEK